MAAWKLWGPGCECCTGCTGTICFTLKQCDTTTAVIGALITLKLSGTTIGTCTTNGSGQCCIAITSAATYDYTISGAGLETKTGTVAATCTTNNVTLTFGASLCVTVLGCNSAVLPNATLTVKSGGTTVATATSNSSGVACVHLLASTGSYSVEVSKSRFGTNTSTRTITCGTTFGVTLSAGTGYQCDICVDPISETLYLTTPISTSVTLTYDSGTGIWTGTETRTITNAWDCSSAGFTTESITFTWGYVSGTLSYTYYLCFAGGVLFSSTADPITGCANEAGVATPGPTGHVQTRTAISVSTSCSAFSLSGTFVAPDYCPPTIGVPPVQYYSGSATLTE